LASRHVARCGNLDAVLRAGDRPPELVVTTTVLVADA
jgi:hypothetical protein